MWTVVETSAPSGTRLTSLSVKPRAMIAGPFTCLPLTVEDLPASTNSFRVTLPPMDACHLKPPRTWSTTCFDALGPRHAAFDRDGR